MIKNIQIDERLHRRIKVTATLSGLTIKEWVEGVLTDALSAPRLVDSRQGYETRGDHADPRDPSPSQIEHEYMLRYGHLPGEDGND
jgi:hypothetical protein